MNNIHYIKDYSPSSSDVYFLDNNIWMILHCPIAQVKQKQQDAYSQFLSQLITRNCAIFINSLIISEFSNRYLKLDFKLWEGLPENKGKEYKRDYTLTDRYKETVQNIRSSLDTILKICNAGSDEFNSLDINKILSDFGKLDFNDSYYLSLCKKKKWKFVTEDKAIINSPSEVTIITTS